MGTSPIGSAGQDLTLIDLALVGSTLFYESGYSAEVLAERFSAATPGTARDFVVLRTLAEVQKFAVSARRRISIEGTLSEDHRYDSLEADALTLQNTVWLRRLLEGLVHLVNFSHTNEHAYFAHFLALRELDRRRRRIVDERDFFGSESELTKRNISALHAKVDDARAQLHRAADCWYLSGRDDYQLSSMRSNYLLALKRARPSEMTALGYTYQLSFGAASEQLHFGTFDGDTGSLDAGTIDAFCGLLAIAIIARSHELCGVAPKGVNMVLIERARNSSIPEFLAPSIDDGDFVLTTGPHIAEVCERRTTAFGYASYRVRFLDTDTGPGVAEDWLPALAVRPFMARKEMIDSVKARMAEHASQIRMKFSEADVVEAGREAVVQMWKAGLREYFRRQVENEAMDGSSK